MNFETLREQARNWRENQEAGSERELGYVVIFNGQIVGWKRELDNPQGWEPCCLAVGIAGSVYQAEGGNAYDGARVWQRLDLPNPALHTSADKAAPKSLQDVLRVRDSAIYEAFNGRNHSELAEVFGLSNRAMYDVLKKEQQAAKAAQAETVELEQRLDALQHSISELATRSIESNQRLLDLARRVDGLQS